LDAGLTWAEDFSGEADSGTGDVAVKYAAIIQKLAQGIVTGMAKHIMEMTSLMGELYLLRSVMFPNRYVRQCCYWCPIRIRC